MKKILGLLLAGPLAFLDVRRTVVGAIYLVLGGWLTYFVSSLFWLWAWVFMGDADAPYYLGQALLLGMIPAALISLLTGLLGGMVAPSSKRRSEHHGTRCNGRAVASGPAPTRAGGG